MTKSEKAIKLIFNKLESFSTYEEKHKFVNETVVDAGRHGEKKITELVDRYPELKDSINRHMFETAIVEYGNPEDQAFTFSRDFSDKKLLETIDMIGKNQEIIDTRFGGSEVMKEKLAQEYAAKDIRRAELKSEKKDLQSSIKARRKEFDDRTGWFSGWGLGGEATKRAGVVGVIADLAMGMGVPAATVATQAVAGWTDLFREEGMEQFETQSFKWDPEHNRYGPGPKISAQQDRLKSVLNALEVLDTSSQEYLAYKDLNDMQNKRLDLLSGTIIDDLIHSGYATDNEIKTLLGE